MITVRRWMLPCCAALLIGIPMAAHSQAFPSKPIRIIAPFQPGAGTDTLARTLAPPLTRALGQNIIVENLKKLKGSGLYFIV